MGHNIGAPGNRAYRPSWAATVPVTRDAQNNVLMLDPASGEGAQLMEIVKRFSGNCPLKLDGREIVVIE